VIRSVLQLRAKPGKESALETFYHEREIIKRARRFPGCQDATLLRSVDSGPATHLVIADWDDAAAYARWVADPYRASVAAELTDLLDLSPDEQVLAGLYAPVTPLPPEQF
jgi:quinol monooxygenase YgiN